MKVFNQVASAAKNTERVLELFKAQQGLNIGALALKNATVFRSGDVWRLHQGCPYFRRRLYPASIHIGVLVLEACQNYKNHKN